MVYFRHCAMADDQDILFYFFLSSSSSGIREIKKSQHFLIPLSTQRMVVWQHLALWLNNPTEIISVTWVCGTPAWDFDRWDCLLLHLQTRAQGNSRQTSHLGWHSHTAHHTKRTKCEVSNKNICGKKKEGEKGIDEWKFMEICGGKRRETVTWLPYCFLISELYMWLRIQAVLVQSRHSTNTVSMQGLERTEA